MARIRLTDNPPANVDFTAVDGWWNWYQAKVKDKRMLPPFIGLFQEECAAAGVNWVVLFCQFCIETGFGKSQLFKDKLNMFGLGAVDSDSQNSAERFRTFRTAIRAGAQHLAVYAGTDKIRVLAPEQFVLERTAKLKTWGYLGIVTYVDEMGGKNTAGQVKWASDPLYGQKIAAMYESIVAYALDDNPKPLPIPPAPPPKLPPKGEPKPVPAPPVNNPPTTTPARPVELPKPILDKLKGIPWLVRVGIKAGVKYSATFVLGLIAAQSEPLRSILRTLWTLVTKLVEQL